MLHETYYYISKLLTFQHSPEYDVQLHLCPVIALQKWYIHMPQYAKISSSTHSDPTIYCIHLIKKSNAAILTLQAFSKGSSGADVLGL